MQFLRDSEGSNFFSPDVPFLIKIRVVHVDVLRPGGHLDTAPCVSCPIVADNREDVSLLTSDQPIRGRSPVTPTNHSAAPPAGFSRECQLA